MLHTGGGATAATRDRSIEERVFKPQKVDQLVKENIRRKKELGWFR